MDLTNTIIPKSDQVNSDDLLTGPRTVTIKEVRRGSSDEQPVSIDLVEFPGRPFKPSKTVRRVLVAAWGKEGDNYAGRRMTIYRDPDVKFGGQDVGGIRVSHLSDIAKPLTLALTATKGKKSKHVVQPLKDEPRQQRTTVDVGEPVATTLPVNPPKLPITGAQIRDIGAGLTKLDITDGEAQLAAVSQVIDREISNPQELTRDEATTVLSWIAHEQASVDDSGQGTLA
jgi:hypothetical protein